MSQRKRAWTFGEQLELQLLSPAQRLERLESHVRQLTMTVRELFKTVGVVNSEVETIRDELQDESFLEEEKKA